MEKSTPELQVPSNIIIVGCGGVASYLLPCLLKLLRGKAVNIELVDADILEERNLDRQLFPPDAIGKNKALALGELHRMPPGMHISPCYFAAGHRVPDGSLLMGCADNHAARRAILCAADETTSSAIIGGNEYTDAEAYFYTHRWHDTPLDPRVYFPEILTDHTNDPVRPEGCQGEAQVITPQLALANMSAANHMLWLFWFYYAEAQHLSERDYWPVRHNNSFSRFGTTLMKDANEKKKAA